MVGRVIEISFVLILVFLVLSNAPAFVSIAKTTGDIYTQAARTLQGRY